MKANLRIVQGWLENGDFTSAEETKNRVCPDCGESVEVGPSRREFLKAAGVVGGSLIEWAVPKATAATPALVKGESETAAKALYESLTEVQRKAVSFDWDNFLGWL